MNPTTHPAPAVRIREDAGLWLINVDHGRLHYARHAWTRDRAEQIAADLVKLALWASEKDATA